MSARGESILQSVIETLQPGPLSDRAEERRRALLALIDNNMLLASQTPPSAAQASKRKTKDFTIDGSDGSHAVKRAWNAALREVERLVRETARREGQHYYLVGSKSVKDDTGFHFIRGYREWRGDNGRVIRYGIARV